MIKQKQGSKFESLRDVYDHTHEENTIGKKFSSYF